MKKFLKYFLILALVPVLVLTSCSDDDDDNPPPEVKGTFADLKTYLVDNDMDLPTVTSGGFILASDIQGKGLSDYHIMDIRGSEDYDLGHIEGAVLSSLQTIVDDAAGVIKPIVVVCSSGQTAGHAVLALRLSGYPDAQVLKWGMSSWNADFASPWQNNIGNAGIDNPNWTMDAVSDNSTFSYPNWESTSTDGAEILTERVNAMLTDGFSAIAGNNVLSAPSDYFINNYWEQPDVDKYGHITTAFRIHPLSLANDEISHLDPDAQVVTYCWTGQTSSLVTAYLTVLGYDAISLKYGANGMIYENLEAHKWSDAQIKDYDYVTTK